MTALIPPPVLPKRGCPPSRWRLVTTPSGVKKIEEINSPLLLPSEVVITPFPVIEMNSHAWKRLRKRELYVTNPAPRPPMGGVNGKGFGPRH